MSRKEHRFATTHMEAFEVSPDAERHSGISILSELGSNRVGQGLAVAEQPSFPLCSNGIEDTLTRNFLPPAGLRRPRGGHRPPPLRPSCGRQARVASVRAVEPARAPHKTGMACCFQPTACSTPPPVKRGWCLVTGGAGPEYLF